METPLGLSDSLRAVVENAKDANDLYQTTMGLPMDRIVELFDYAADSETWIEEKGGKPFIIEMIAFFNLAALKHQLSPAQLLLVGKAIRRNHKVLLKWVPLDLTFVVQEEKFKVNSLLFRVFGEQHFANLIDDYVISRRQSEIKLTGVLRKTFEYIKEFIYTERMENLWKEEPKAILSLQKRGNKWRLKEVSEYAFKTYKNYINKEVLFKRLVAAFLARNVHLTEELLGVLDKENLGFSLTLVHETGFHLELHSFYGEVESVLEPLLNSVFSLSLSKQDIDEFLFKQLLSKCKHLEEIDLSNFKVCENPADFIQSLPPLLKILHLNELSWVDNGAIQTIVAHLHNLRILNLSGCDHFQPTILSELSLLKELDELNLSNNQSLTTTVLKIICPLFKTIKRLNLTNCQGVNDLGLQIIAHEMRELEELYLAKIRNISEQALLDLTGNKMLRLLDLRQMAQIPLNYKERNQRRFFRTEILI